MTRSILKHMNVPNYLWGEVVRHATYIINRVATRTLVDQTPYEAFQNKKPNVDHLHIFGCIGYAKSEATHLKKLDDRSRMLVHLGTEPGSIAYSLLDPTKQTLVVSRDVVFDEDTNLEVILEFKKGMARNFEMSDLGKLTYYLGIEVIQIEDGILLSQERYAKKILECSSYTNVC